MSAAEIDHYLAQLDDRARATLEELRRSILAVIPQAEQCISYAMPAFKIEGKTIAGFAAFTHHLSYFPHSGSVLAALAADLAGYGQTKSSLHFSAGEPLPDDLVAKLVHVRMEQAGLD